MILSTQKHSTDQISGRDARSALHNKEALGSLDESIAVLSTAVRGYIVSVYDIMAAIVGDPGKGGDIGGVLDGARRPAAGIYSRHAASGQLKVTTGAVTRPTALPKS